MVVGVAVGSGVNADAAGIVYVARVVDGDAGVAVGAGGAAVGPDDDAAADVVYVACIVNVYTAVAVGAVALPRVRA